MAERPNEYRVGVTSHREYFVFEWKNQIPTETGWYWLYMGDNIPDDNYTRIVHIEKHTSGYLGISNGDYLETLEDYVGPYPSRWLGPLPLPEFPSH